MAILPGKGPPVEKPRKYPKFRHPEKYLECRERASLLSIFKVWIERRTIRKLIGGRPGIRTVCDAPSGPGRLFSLWSSLGCRVYGVDISPPMVHYASRMRRQLVLEGEDIEGDVFDLEGLLPETPDLVACIRFMYYFNPEERVCLLRALARASRRYVLLQYKTAETFKGRRNLARQSNRQNPGRRHLRWHFASRPEIEDELRQAGLTLLEAVNVGPFSDRVFVIAEKRPCGSTQQGLAMGPLPDAGMNQGAT